MKQLIENDLEFNSEGTTIADDFGKLVEEFIITHDLTQYNPIELSWMLNNELNLRMTLIYCDTAMGLQQ